MHETIDDPFRPFVATDDGATLELRHARRAGDVLMRALMYLLLVLVLGLLALIPYAAWTRGRGVGDAVLALVFLVPTWLVLRVVVWGLRMEGISRILLRPGAAVRWRRGVLLRGREELRGVTGVEATTITQSTEYGPVRWLHVRVLGEGGPIDLLNLHLDREAEPTREAAAQAAAATIAARLRAPLVLDGRPISPT